MIDTLLKFWPAGFAVMNLFGLWVMWSLRHTFASRGDLEALRAELSKAQKATADRAEESVKAVRAEVAEVRDDVENVREALGRTATHAEMAELQRTLAAVGGDVKELRATVQGMGAAVAGVAENLNMLIKHHVERGR